jgi:hypothetical protein
VVQQRFVTGRRLVGVVVLAVVASVLGLAPASAAPATVPAPVRHLLAEAHQPAAKPSTTVERHALRIPGEEEEQTFVGFNPGCATGGGKVKPNAFVYAETKLKLDWVLTGTGLHKKGTVKTKVDRTVALKLPTVRAGDYRLTLALHKKTDLVADETFDVLPCVAVKATCRAVTFTNPAGNPAAYVTYSGHKKSQEFDLELAPGASRTVRADYTKIDYDASSDDPDADTDALGHGTITVKQHCSHGPAQPADNAVQTFGFAGCSLGGAPADVSLSWSVQPSVAQRRYEVLGAGQQVVAQGSFKGGHDTDVTLPAGTYTYRSYANAILQPFEDVSFTVLACVEVTPKCQAIRVHNPNAAALTVVVFSTDDEQTEIEGDGDETALPANGTVTIPWTGSTAWVLALAGDDWSGSGSGFFSLASALTDDGDPTTTTVPQSC